MYSVTSFVFLKILATLYKTSVQFTGRSGGAICLPVEITHLLNFSTVTVLLNTGMVLQLLRVVNNSKTLSTVWEK